MLFFVVDTVARGVGDEVRVRVGRLCLSRGSLTFSLVRVRLFPLRLELPLQEEKETLRIKYISDILHCFTHFLKFVRINSEWIVLKKVHCS